MIREEEHDADSDGASPAKLQQISQESMEYMNDEEVYANFERRSDSESAESEKKHDLEIWVSDDLTSEESEGDQSHEFPDAVPIDGDRQD